MSEKQVYDAGDLYDAYSLAECDMQWMCNAIRDLRSQIQELKKEVESGTAISKYHFDTLITRSDMYEYLAENRTDSYTHNVKALQQEWETLTRSNQS
ncbi:hypothetical protein ACLIL3_014880 [Acinetobacter radioresistens]|uniref:hypothetical protein n=1 Tax=Acinetobacter radioresistens TaxID=40216 RepID=UPI003984AF0E